MILETKNVIMNLDELIRNDRDWSVSRICSTITQIYIKFENIIGLQLRCLFYINNIQIIILMLKVQNIYQIHYNIILHY